MFINSVNTVIIWIIWNYFKKYSSLQKDTLYICMETQNYSMLWNTRKKIEKNARNTKIVWKQNGVIKNIHEKKSNEENVLIKLNRKKTPKIFRSIRPEGTQLISLSKTSAQKSWKFDAETEQGTDAWVSTPFCRSIKRIYMLNASLFYFFLLFFDFF